MSRAAVIHSSADVSVESYIGDETTVWQQAQVRERASIGSGCVLAKGVYVDFEVVIGNNCKLQNNVSVFHPAILEDGVFLGPGVIVTNDRVPRAVNPDGTIKGSADWQASPVRIGKGAAIGAASVILAGVTIGRWALVGAATVVLRDVPDHGLVVGNPGRLMGYVCACGTRVEDEDDATKRVCPSCALHTAEALDRRRT